MNARTISFFIVVLFSLSLFVTPADLPATSEATESAVSKALTEINPPQTRSTLADYPENYTEVEWEQGVRSEGWTDQWNHSDWEYGPTITWNTRNATNNALISMADVIDLDGWFNFYLDVPKTTITTEIPWALAIQGSWFNASNLDTNKPGQDGPGDMSSEVNFLGIIVLDTGRWDIYSSTNLSMDEEPPGDLPANWTLESIFGPQIEPFLEINELQSTYSIGTDSIRAKFNLLFNQTTLPGFYTFSAVAIDSNLNTIASSMHGEIVGRTVGITFEEVVRQAVGGWYTWSRYDDDGNALYSVSRGVEFNMTVEATGTNLDNVTIFIDLPNQIEIERLEDGPYFVEENVTGGWQFDATAGTYFYNSSVNTTYYREFHGIHTVKDFTHLDNTIMIEYYDPWIADDVTDFRRVQMAVSYNFSSGNFTTWLTWEVPTFEWFEGSWWELRSREFIPFPQNGSVIASYILNSTTSSHTVVGDMHNVTFRGHISEEMLPTGGEFGQPLWFHVDTFDLNGKRLAKYYELPMGSEADRDAEEALKQLAVETPLAFVRLLHKGQPYNPSWMFQTDSGETFTVKADLQGGAELLPDIDGIVFSLDAFEDSWGREADYDWNQFNEIHVIARILPDGSSEVEVYNHTHRTEWGFGGHYEEQYVELFPGTWIWQEVWVDSWYWQDLYWDQNKSQWTSEPFDLFDSRALMQVQYIDVGNLSYSVIGNDLKVQFDVTPDPSLPEREYEWRFIFGNLTWINDYTQPYGEQAVMGWVEETVYSYVNVTDRVWTDQPMKSLVFRNNDTDVLYEYDKRPFIDIDGEKLPVKVIKEEHPDGTVSQRIILDKFDPNAWNEVDQAYTGAQVFFYELLNGTTIPITSGRRVEVYNVTVPGYGWFLSFGNQTEYIPETGSEWLMAINGTAIIAPPGTWAIADLNTLFKIAPVVESGLVILANHTIPIYLAMDPIWIDDYHMVLYINGTWEPVDVWFDTYFRAWYYYNFTDSKIYVFHDGPWPQRVFRGLTTFSNRLVPERFTKFFAYYDSGTGKYPLPAPGIYVYDIWELEWRTPARELVNIDNAWYPVVPSVGGTDSILGYDYPNFTADVMGTPYNLTYWCLDPSAPWNPRWSGGDTNSKLAWVSVANSSISIIDLQHHDWSLAYGHMDSATWTFVRDGWIDVTTGYFEMFDWGPDGQVFDPNPLPHVITERGEFMTYNETFRVLLFNVTLSNGTFFYTGRPEPWEKLNLNNVTNEVEPEFWYMYDIDGVMQNWTTWMEFTVELIPVNLVNESFNQFFFDGLWRDITSFEFYQYDYDTPQWYTDWWEQNVIQEQYTFLDALNGTIYEIIELGADFRNEFNIPSFNFTVDGFNYFNLTGRRELVYKRYTVWGHGLRQDLAPLPVTIQRQQHSLVIGSPRFGMWSDDLWAVDPSNGALDLDGNLETTADQFYVRKMYESSDTFNITEEYLNVNILWEPNNTLYGDEFNLNSRAGMVTFNWSSQWSDNHIWYDAETGEVVNATVLSQINNTLFFANGDPKPGYWGVSWLGRNFTSADLKAQAQDEGWDWVPQTSQTWSWLWWELDENYSTEISNGTHIDTMDINLAYEYAGMFAWNDTNSNALMDIDTSSVGSAELTHYWMPMDLESVSFITPGIAWGYSSSTGLDYRPVDETITFGVSFNNVTGQVFPFGAFSYWDWYAGQYYGSDFATFNERPSDAGTDEFALTVHFTGHINATGTNYAEVKFDVLVGDWNIDTPGGRSVLEDLSLAVAFYSQLSITSSVGEEAISAYYDETGNPISNNQTIKSSNYTMGSGLSTVALMSLGGAPYNWSYDPTLNTTVDAQTVPLSTFSAIYTSGSDESATSFTVSSEQFYTVIGFKWWDGYEVSVDPVFVGYLSSGFADTTAPQFSGIDTSMVIVSDTEYLQVDVRVTDSGGSDVASVKVWDTDNNVNYTAFYSAADGFWRATIPRLQDTEYTFNYVVVVRDNAGNEALSSPQSFTFLDIALTPPLISGLTHTPQNPKSTEAVIISATVLDVTGVDVVILQYRIGDGDWIDEAMTADGDVYSAYIPAQPDGTRVTYRVYASDLSGNDVHSAEQFYIVMDEEPPPPGEERPLLWLIGGFFAIVVMTIVLAGLRKRK